jgi:hypothetical protein
MTGSGVGASRLASGPLLKAGDVFGGVISATAIASTLIVMLMLMLALMAVVVLVPPAAVMLVLVSVVAAATARCLIGGVAAKPLLLALQLAVLLLQSLLTLFVALQALLDVLLVAALMGALLVVAALLWAALAVFVLVLGHDTPRWSLSSDGRLRCGSALPCRVPGLGLAYTPVRDHRRSATLGTRASRPGGRGVWRCESSYGVEEGPDSAGRSGGQHPPEVTRGTVPQRQTASGPDARIWVRVRVKRWCKRPPAPRVTGAAG